MTLDLDFRVLFPASDIHWHVIKGDFLFEELVHLSLNRVLITSLDKGGGVIDARHRIEIFVLARVHTTRAEVIIEQVLSMATVGNTIVNE